MTNPPPVGRGREYCWKCVGLIKALECKKNEFVLIGLKVLFGICGTYYRSFFGFGVRWAYPIFKTDIHNRVFLK